LYKSRPKYFQAPSAAYSALSPNDAAPMELVISKKRNTTNMPRLRRFVPSLLRCSKKQLRRQTLRRGGKTVQGLMHQRIPRIFANGI
jgi:hypothetical protein